MTDVQREEMEREANYFAMCLLMPEKLLRHEVSAIGGLDLCDDEKLKALARKFGVAQGLMAIRIMEVYGNLI
jgi:Zn-dependent peptidase ImmA (M78 family)